MGTHWGLRLFLATAVQLRHKVIKGDIHMFYPSEDAKQKPKCIRLPEYVREAHPGMEGKVLGNLYGDILASEQAVTMFREFLVNGFANNETAPHPDNDPDFNARASLWTCVYEANEAAYVAFFQLPDMPPVFAQLWTHSDDWLMSADRDCASHSASFALDHQVRVIRLKYVVPALWNLDDGPIKCMGANICFSDDKRSITMCLSDWARTACHDVFDCEPEQLKPPTSPIAGDAKLKRTDAPAFLPFPDAERRAIQSEFGKYGSFASVIGKGNFMQELCEPTLACAMSLVAPFASDPSKQAWMMLLRAMRWGFHRHAVLKKGIHFSSPTFNWDKLRLRVSSDYAKPTQDQLEEYKITGDVKVLLCRFAFSVDMNGPLWWGSHRQKQLPSGPIEGSSEGELYAYHYAIRRAGTILKAMSYMDHKLRPDVSPPNVHEGSPVLVESDNTGKMRFIAAPIPNMNLHATMIKVGILRAMFVNGIFRPHPTPGTIVVANAITKGGGGKQLIKQLDMLCGYDNWASMRDITSTVKPFRCFHCWTDALNYHQDPGTLQWYAECRGCGRFTGT